MRNFLAPAAAWVRRDASLPRLSWDLIEMMAADNDNGLRKVLAIRLRKSERALVEQKAAEAGLPPATYIREAALRAIVAPVKPDIPPINREAWAALARVCANLNQYQAAINSGKTTGYPSFFLEDLRDQVQRLRRELIGVRDEDADQ